MIDGSKLRMNVKSVSNHPQRRTVAIWLVVVLALSALVSAAMKSRVTDASTETLTRDLSGPGDIRVNDTTWDEVDELIEQQKFQAASERVEDLLNTSIEDKDSEQWTRSLIRLVQLQTALHGYETAVRSLLDRPWPADELPRATLQLFYAQGLVNYLRAYSWEIRSREQIGSNDEIDLKRLTSSQIVSRAQEAYIDVWNRRHSFGDQKIGVLEDYLVPNNYPPRIRGTLRDGVTYLWVELLSDTALWRPKELNELFRIDLESLIEGDSSHSWDPDPNAVDPHPLVRVSQILGDLERWHESAGRPEAAAQARIEKLRRLHGSFDQKEDRNRIQKALEDLLAEMDRELEWWSVGQAELARMVAEGSEPDSLIQARAIAIEGQKLHPGTLGARLCANVIDTIEAPDYSLASMKSDGADRRSIEVLHKNLEGLYFRAYPVDVRRQIEVARDYNLLPGYREIPEIIESQSPTANWRVDLPPTRDFRTHRTWVTPPLSDKGLYLIVASVDEEFRIQKQVGNRLIALYLQITDLTILTRDVPNGFEVEIRSGESGRPVAAVDVDLLQYDYQKGHHHSARRRTGVGGVVRFPVRAGRHRGYFLVAESSDDLSLDLSQQRVAPRQRRPRKTTTLIYTDRSVYRPMQQVLWKVVAYEGVVADGDLVTLPSRAVTVHLLDANGEEVSSIETTTNRFGSASGSFEIPNGRMLGAWRLQTSLGGQSSIRVEEYKRPSFEVSIADPESPLRLNRNAVLEGKARYYFGLPVASGQVQWMVERVPLYPPWWHWWYGAGAVTTPQVVASGSVPLDADGEFQIAFVPRADERKSDIAGLTFNYRLGVDVTDEGGETRSAERSLRLGFVSVTAEISSDESFFSVGEAARFSVRRTDLNGVPRPGDGAWRVLRLRQPEAALLPADQPVPATSDDKAIYQTPGDRLRSRWAPGYDPAQILRLWQGGAQVARGESSHDDKGFADIELGGLEPGAFRLEYRTLDEFGAEFESQHEFIVTGSGELPVALPALMLVERSSVQVGQRARILVHTALEDQLVELEIFRNGSTLERIELQHDTASGVVEFPIMEAHRGGLGVRLSLLRDHQLITLNQSLMVPWDDRELDIRFSSFRDMLRPGSRETWRVEVGSADGRALESGVAELLAYMYDRSLDLFAPHTPPDIASIYPTTIGYGRLSTNLGSSYQVWTQGHWRVARVYSPLHGDRLVFFDNYPIGGLGRGRKAMQLAFAGSAPAASARLESTAERDEAFVDQVGEAVLEEVAATRPADPGESSLRSDFSETAFWKPHLVLDETGSVAFEFSVPDSVTDWNVWVHALTNDLRGGSLQRRSRSVKDLMVRPYLPRFLREGDRAQLRVAVNNASDVILEGHLDLEIRDAESATSLLSEFGLSQRESSSVPFRVAAGQGQTLIFEIEAPVRVGMVVVEVRARSGHLSDGEARPMPLLPGRMHLSQSRFAALRDRDRRVLSFTDLGTSDDPSLVNEQMVVTLDAQLFYGVLKALPYLIEYPYECTEQTLNRFVSTGIVSSLYESYPAVADMARQFSDRGTRVETWNDPDPNRKMSLEETPWLIQSRGGDTPYSDLVNVLDPKIARAQMQASIAKLQQAQTPLGGFPWWAGGPPSPYMTLYLLHGLSRAIEFEVDVPQQLVVDAWRYLHRHYVDEIIDQMVSSDCCWSMVTFLNYVLSSYPDDSWFGGVFDDGDRKRMLDFSFRHWKAHSPLLKSYLALTLSRAERIDDARLVFSSVMDSAKTSRDEGVFWAPEDRAWLWYNDTIETHAFALRTLLELDPADERRHGLVQWLFLNKKMNHWKSTRATAEVVYALTRYLESEGTLGARESATVRVAGRIEQFVFEPETYTGDRNQIVLSGDEVTTMAAEGTDSIVVEKDTPGLLFASATWHFSTQQLPDESSGDLFSVQRSYFKRVASEEGFTLLPIREGAPIEVGDQVEVHLSIRTRSAAEYVHLRDPRGAGFEPDSTSSGYKWQLGISWYEEIRDSGTNFFFESLPVGEYTLRYRVRASMAGTFRVSPATLQSMYAPEFTGYSAGSKLNVGI